MGKWIQRVPPLQWVYEKIAEPRVVRLLYFGMFICMLVAGVVLLSMPPERYQDVVGLTLVYVLGTFLTAGGLLSAVAVLPGVWWLERVGIILLATGMAIYIVIVLTLAGSIIGVTVPLAFILAFGVRWIDIRKYQLAPLTVTVPREE
jgi:hypothetical protein